jgi:outer membrane protein assembly factor BamB
MAGSAALAPPAESGRALLENTGVKGGLCLVVGAKDISLANELATGSSLYIQVLQPDAGLALQWGAAIVNATNRESLGIRNAALDPDHYGSDLFNLIVVEDAGGMGKTKLADLSRMLVPAGSVVVRSAGAGFTAEASALGMSNSMAGAYTAYRKPVKPVAWKPTTAQKWRAGAVAQYCSFFSGLTSGGGRMFYRERMEVDGTLATSRSQLFARDENNGRLLWTLEEPVGWGPWVGQWEPRNFGMEADNQGRLFVATAEGKFVCLDAATGKLKYELIDNNARPGFTYVHGDFVFAYGKLFSAVDGKFIRPMSNTPMLEGGAPLVTVSKPAHFAGEDSYYECDGRTLTTKKILDGSVVKSVPLDGSLPRSNLWFGVYGKHLVVGNGAWMKIEKMWGLDSSSGKLLWTHTVSGAMLTAPFGHNEMTRFVPTPDKVVIVRRPPGPPPPKGPHEFLVTRIDMATGNVEEENRSLAAPMRVGHCTKWEPMDLGDYMAFYDVWINKRTREVVSGRNGGVACFAGEIVSKDMGLIFNFPSRKNQWITATGPTDPPTSPAPGVWKSLLKMGALASPEPTRDDDWIMFRNGPGCGNAGKATVGDTLVKAWETAIGLGGRSYGVMCGERTGLTQPVSAYGVAVVSDLEGQRVVAVDVASGKQKWAFHVGSRVDHSPALCKGMCLFAAADGWVYGLDARTGALLWKNMFAERERYVGSREKLESSAPRSSVMVANGTGFIGGVAFKPETGERDPAPGKAAGGRQLGNNCSQWGLQVDDIMSYGNSLPRNIEDRAGFLLIDGRVKGRLVSFDDALSVAYNGPKGERPDCAGMPLVLTAAGSQSWSTPPSDLVVDDIVVTPTRIYTVGHYQRIKKTPELWVMSREDGKVLSAIPVDGFPAFFGMSAAGNRLFVATREGRLICFAAAR